MTILLAGRHLDFGATKEFWALEGQHMQISQKLLWNERDNNSSFCEGVSEFDHRIFALLKQQRERPDKFRPI